MGSEGLCLSWCCPVVTSSRALLFWEPSVAVPGDLSSISEPSQALLAPSALQPTSCQAEGQQDEPDRVCQDTLRLPWKGKNPACPCLVPTLAPQLMFSSIWEPFCAVPSPKSAF